MRIDISEPSLIRLFEKGQVGMIRTEFMRQFDVIEQLALQKAELTAENANLKALQWETLKERNKAEAENERLRKAGEAVCESPYLLETDEAVIAWRAAAKEGDSK